MCETAQYFSCNKHVEVRVFSEQTLWQGQNFLSVSI